MSRLSTPSYTSVYDSVRFLAHPVVYTSLSMDIIFYHLLRKLFENLSTLTDLYWIKCVQYCIHRFFWCCM